MNIDKTQELCKKIDTIIINASQIEPFLKINSVRDTSLEAIYLIYRTSNYYDAAITEKLMNYLIDIRLEQFYVEDFDPICVSKIVGPDNLGSLDIAINPKPVLYLSAIMQSVILRSRILFERIINFVYLVCKKKQFEFNKKTNKFFELLDNDPAFIEWKYLASYKELIQKYDNIFRTPEVHKNSYLRALLVNDQRKTTKIILAANQVLAIQNGIGNLFWITLKYILEGKQLPQEMVERIKLNCDDLLSLISIRL